MIQVTPQMRILLAVEPADFRKGIDGLAAVCRQVLKKDPFSELFLQTISHLAWPDPHFVFCAIFSTTSFRSKIRPTIWPTWSKNYTDIPMLIVVSGRWCSFKWSYLSRVPDSLVETTWSPNIIHSDFFYL